MTLKELGEALGMPISTIHRLEHGKTVLNKPKLKIYSAYFNAPLDWILYGFPTGGIKSENISIDAAADTSGKPQAVKLTIDLANLRKKRGWLQWQSAKELGVARSYISAVETGRLHVSENLMRAVMRVYGVKREDFRQVPVSPKKG